MADKKISQLANGGAIQDTDLIPIARGGQNYSLSGSVITSKQDALTPENVGAFTNSLTEKTTPVDADMVQLMDSAASNVMKKLSWANIKATILNTANTFTKAQGVAPVALTSTANSVATDASLSNIFTHTLTENTTLANPTNLVAGRFYTWKFTQDSTPRTLAFGNLFKWASSTPLVISTGSGAIDIITGLYDGTNINTVITGQNFL